MIFSKKQDRRTLKTLFSPQAFFALFAGIKPVIYGYSPACVIYFGCYLYFNQKYLAHYEQEEIKRREETSLVSDDLCRDVKVKLELPFLYSAG